MSGENGAMERIFDRLVEESSGPVGWWWLSFADATLPKGSQFLGVVIIEAQGMGTATSAATLRGLNPGGAVVGFPIPPEHVPPAEFRNRLLSRAEAEALP